MIAQGEALGVRLQQGSAALKGRNSDAPPHSIAPFQGFGSIAALAPQGGALGYHIPAFQAGGGVRQRPAAGTLRT